MAVVAEQTSKHEEDSKKPKLTLRKLIPLGLGIAFFVIVGFAYIPFDTLILVFVLVYLPFIFAFANALYKSDGGRRAKYRAEIKVNKPLFYFSTLCCIAYPLKYLHLSPPCEYDT